MTSSLLKELGFLGLVIVGVFLLMPKNTATSFDTNIKVENKDKLLRFNKNGEFKILQISDMHYANGKDTPCRDVLPSQMESCSDLNTTHYLRRFIDVEKPDLILFTGDNVHSMEAYNYNRSMDEVFAAAIESNIPWAAILGNHDVNVLQTGFSRQAVMEYIVGMKNTLSLLNPSNLQQGESIWGYGNYNLEVAGFENSPFRNKSVLNLYLLDTGDYTYSLAPTFYMGYEWIQPSQQSWFLRTSKQLQQAYTSPPEAQQGPAPGLAFFHIPIPEFNKIKESEMVGVKQEHVICPGVNSGFFDTMLEAGDIKAAFVGHGHVNDYCGKLCDIQLCYDAGFGYHGYGLAGWARRARVINVKLDKTKDGNNWGPVKSILTWKRLHDDRLTLIDPEVLWTSTTGGDGDQSLFKPIMSE
ncbi:probable inactive purple acid phosphatase 29 [Chenopodium quinoa]|uniref:probable inactive purple acid phosphatase 29 n=1 Tax=Chenopodium quinoa TaxID=63459 RepID=UPI000B76D54B|nr:probable inactive purple acid phosphatase 29 [Chenopodium quinoa]